MTALPAVTINIKESPDGSAEKVYTVPPYGSTGQQVKLTREENPPESGFLKFIHTSPDGSPFKVSEVRYGATPASDLNPSDGIKHLAVWYWDNDQGLKTPLLVEVKVNDTNFRYSSNKGGGDIQWSPAGTTQLSGKELEQKLDGLNCSLNNAVTINLTFQNSEVHKNNNTYCCSTHSHNGISGRVSVTINKVSCKGLHQSADCYKHTVNTGEWRVAAIKYDPTGEKTRNRITLNGHKSPPSVTTVYAFYKNNNPKLIYVEGNEENKWFKSPTGINNKDEQWTKVSTNIKGITPDSASGTCTNWTQLKNALTEAKCGIYQECNKKSNTVVSFETPPPPPQKPGASAGAGHQGPDGDAGGSGIGELLRSIIGGLTSGAIWAISNKKVLETITKVGETSYDLANTTGIDTLKAALEITEKALEAHPPEKPAESPTPTSARSTGGLLEAPIAIAGYFFATSAGSGLTGFLGYKGINDGDGTYVHKEISRQYLLDFFGKPKDHYRRKRTGAYFSISYINPKDPEDHVKIIVLDTRYNRECFYNCICKACKLTFIKSRSIFLKRLFNAFLGIGCNHPGDVLGEEQWEWLQGQLYESDAKAHVIVSSFQVFTTFPVSESWGLLPSAKKRLLDLIKETKPKKPLIISGDVHYGEIIQNKGMVEITSSSLTHSLCHHSMNRHKTIRFMLSFYKTDIYLFNNYGIIEFDYDPSTSQIKWDGGIYSESGERVLGYVSPFDEDLYQYVNDRDSFFMDYKIIKCKSIPEILRILFTIFTSLAPPIALVYAIFVSLRSRKQKVE
ncbi:hypothetical protein BEWA_049850 [Theileria equi strain WA]|uniref:PhoD-like phosphatase metallophosphatase domain-containing protein n=1 Tax=Theileria equi strain WA TaxID=1537102 RepID=L1LBG7_THEEQ|nr:hypothetical protein BEWA_049850 [Theileria equi strain WA]EKX72518.1 hypothetical protein BEWA_049850 [Theileria equi strain WA]|eukprot:XP_004831970.1 hypothetical protein BEWA_049850 [Theileria equi strain WA]